MRRIGNLILLVLLFVGSMVPPSTAQPMKRLKVAPGTVTYWYIWKNNIIAFYDDGMVSVWSLGSGTPMGHFQTSPGDGQPPICIDSLGALLLNINGPTAGSPKIRTRYSLPEGKPEELLSVPTQWSVCGFDQKGQHCYALHWNDLQAFSVNPQTSKQDWLIDYSDLVKDKTYLENMPITYFMADGSGIILFVNGRLVARDVKGKELWSRLPDNEERWEPALSSTIVESCLLVRDAENNRLLGLNVADGKTNWILNDVPEGAFRDYNDATGMIAIESKTELHFYDPKDTFKITTIKNVDREMEVRFTKDGKQLIVLSPLKVVGDKPPSTDSPDTRQISRVSPVAVVVDAANGKEIRRIELKHPE